jgi:ubiquinone/menaquinone biosynthesis C-methylase UbiE
MAARLIVDTLHNLHLTGLMLFKPATLFHKIYSLPWYQETLHAWVGSLEYDAGSSILEVGCATGQLTEYMAALGIHTVGVDNSAKMLKTARASTATRVRFELASALKLPFADNQFDCVIAASLLNIISQPEMALDEMLRVCKAGGKISVLVPRAGMTDVALDELSDKLNLSGFSRAALTSWHRRAPKMQRTTLLEYFNTAGISSIEYQTYLNGLVMAVTGTK